MTIDQMKSRMAEMGYKHKLVATGEGNFQLHEFCDPVVTDLDFWVMTMDAHGGHAILMHSFKRCQPDDLEPLFRIAGRLHTDTVETLMKKAVGLEPND